MRRSVPAVGRSLVQEARRPRYVEVADALAEAISNGTYPVGSTVPSEAELCVRFLVSRFTARAALGALQKKGLLSRKPKVGSVVVAKDVQTKYSVLVNSTADLLRFSGSTTVRPVKVEDVTLDAGQAAELGGVEGEQWIRVSTCRISPETGLAVSWTEYYLRPDLRAIVPLIGAKRRPVYALIEEFNGRSIVRIEQKIEACTLPGAIAKALDAPLRSPALRATHRLFSRGDPRPFYSILSLYPAGRFHLMQTLTREP